MTTSTITPKKLTLRPHFNAYLLGEDKVVLKSEKRNLALNGGLFKAVLPLLDGSKTEDEVVRELSGQFPATHIYYALAQLEQQGLMTTVADSGDKSERAFWSAVDLHEGSEKRVQVWIKDMMDCQESRDALQAALQSVQISCVEEDKADLIVCLVNDYLQAELAQWNTHARKKQLPWLLARIDGPSLWVGPFFCEHQPACWDCMAYRLRFNSNQQQIADANCVINNPAAALATTRAIGLNLIATEIAKWSRNRQAHSLNTHLLTLDLASFETRLHPVPEYSDCRTCGSTTPASADATGAEARSTVQLVSREKVFIDDGGYRACHPQVTVQRLQELISPLTGVLPDPVRASVDDDRMFVYHIPGFGPEIGSANSVRLSAAGKGATEAQAQASCLAEALERYSCCYRGSEPRVSASYKQMKDKAVHPSQLVLYSDKQYAEETAHGLKVAQLDDNAPINWTPNWSLTHQTVRWLPTSYCYFGAPQEGEHPYCRIESNGCAAGNTLEEATLQGFLELIERDALAMFWYNRALRQGIDLSSFDDPFFNEMLHCYKKRGRKLAVLEITNDIGIPVVVATSWDSDGSKMLLGAGAHLDSRLAISRAISEVNQMLPLVAPGDLNESFEPSIKARPHKGRLLTWLQTESIASQPFMAPDAVPLRTANQMPAWRSSDLLEDIDACKQAVEKLGLEVLLLDITRDDLKFPVARVTVPELRNLRGLAPGRLYDIPAQLGWVKKALTEQELNPYPFLW